MATQDTTAAGPEMATQDAPAAGPELPARLMTERKARFLPGLRMLVLGIAGLLAGVALAVVASHLRHGAAVALGLLCVAIFIASALALGGLTPVVPGRARVVQLFGRYRGTIRDSGLQWVNPFTRRIAVSTRIRNQESAQAKVNDADGNPIEIAAVVGARQKIVEGAVGMVQLALQRLEAEGVVELDEERKATMVSNLLVVLCSEQATQPVVNTGSLYQ